MISSPETTTAGLANLICCDWLKRIVWHSWYSVAAELEVPCRIEDTMVSRSGFLWNTLLAAVIYCKKDVIRGCPCFDFQHRGQQWTSAYSLFFFPSHSFVVDVWFEERWWMSTWFWGVQITFPRPIILTQELVVWSIPVRTRWVWRN